MKSWYAVQTRSNFEGKVHDTLCRCGIENLYPSYQKRSRWKDRDKLVVRPLFPGYLFVEIARSERAAAIGVSGVVGLVGGSNDPFPVSDFEILQVRLLIANPELVSPAISYLPRTGDTVEVVSGVFQGITGSVERWKEKQSRVEVTVQIAAVMGAARVQVDAECLRKVKAAAA
jgi:transcription antitermination factor NusG